MGQAFTPAGNDSSVFPTAIQLFAGEVPVTTNRAQGAPNVNLAQYQVISLVNGLIVAHEPGGSGDAGIAAGILCTPLDTRAAEGVPGRWTAYYNGGDFNHMALVWAEATNTFALRKAAFASTGTIKISTVL